MESYRYKPLEGLLKLNKQDYKSVNLLETLNKVEEDVSSSPKGRTKRLMLFFYVINILKNNNIKFYVKGGLILQYFLEEHARATNDLDILIPNDADDFYHQVKDAFLNNPYGLSIEITSFEKEEANIKYYFPTFYMRLLIKQDEEIIDTISLEGIYGTLFDKVTPKEYPGPFLIEDNFTILGVSLECVFADKILAITSELSRPYKHLIDAYSISQIDVNIDELQRYLNIALSIENITRQKLGINIDGYQYEIKPNKMFYGSYLFPLIQAGYTYSFDELVHKMNQYMSTHLK